MNVTVETRKVRDGVAVVTLGGEVDVYTAPRVKQALVDLLGEGYTSLVVLLDGVDYLDSTGLGALIGGRRRAREHGGAFRLVCDNPRLRRILDITDLTAVFDLDTTEAEALAKLGEA
jgi:anti-sigma B factor antagonist